MHVAEWLFLVFYRFTVVAELNVRKRKIYVIKKLVLSIATPNLTFFDFLFDPSFEKYFCVLSFSLTS